MKIRILPSALEDLDRGRRFYARHEKALGDYFLDSLFSDIDSLALYAGAHMTVFGFHRLLARRFPYTIYYKMERDACLVFRVLDCRQAPQRTRKALKETKSQGRTEA